MAGSCGWQIPVLLFEGASKFANGAVLHPNGNSRGTLAFPSSPAFIIACLFLLWPLVGMKCRLIVFLICISQVTNGFEHFYVLYIFKIKDIHCRKLKIPRKSKGKKKPLWCFHNLNINTVMFRCGCLSCMCVCCIQCACIFVDMFAYVRVYVTCMWRP